MVLLCDLPCDPEAKPGSLRLGCHERIEDLLCGARRETRPVIAHFDDDRALVASDADLDQLGAVFPRLNRLLNHIAQREPHPIRVDTTRPPPPPLTHPPPTLPQPQH